MVSLDVSVECIGVIPTLPALHSVQTETSVNGNTIHKTVSLRWHYPSDVDAILFQ